MTDKPKRPRDANQLAKAIVDIATGEFDDAAVNEREESEMTRLGRAGGLKGGKARARALSSEERSRIAKLAAQKRWAAKSTR